MPNGVGLRHLNILRKNTWLISYLINYYIINRIQDQESIFALLLQGYQLNHEWLADSFVHVDVDQATTLA